MMRSSFQVYGGHALVGQSKRSDLTQSGCSFIDTPHDGRKETADKLLIADILLWAMDNPPPAKIVLMCGDKDLSYVSSRLVSRSYTVVLVHNRQAVDRLKQAASFAIAWEVLTAEPEIEQEDDDVDDRVPLDEDDDALDEKLYSFVPNRRRDAPIKVASMSPFGQSRLSASAAVVPFRPSNSLGQFVWDGDNVSVAGSSEEMDRAAESGVYEIIEILKAMDLSRNPLGRCEWHAAASVADRLRKKNPLLKEQYAGRLSQLWEKASQAKAIELKYKEQEKQVKNAMLKLFINQSSACKLMNACD